MKTYQLITLHGYQYVLCSPSEGQNGNFMGTGLVLAGVLKKTETLEEWITKHGK